MTRYRGWWDSDANKLETARGDGPPYSWIELVTLNRRFDFPYLYIYWED